MVNIEDPNGEGVEGRQASIYIVGESVSQLNIFVGIWQCLAKLNANVCEFSRLAYRILSYMDVYKNDNQE